MPRKPVMIFFAALFLASAACAQETKKEVWEPVLPGPFTTLTAPLIEKNKLVVQPLYFFNIARGTFNGEGNYKALEGRDYKYSQVIQLYTQYSPVDRLEFNVQPQWQINQVRSEGSASQHAGFGDLLMNVRWCPIDESYWCPAATPIFQVKLPTGNFSDPYQKKLMTDTTGTGSTDYTFGVSFTKGIKPVEWHLDVLWVTSPAPVRIDGVKTQFADQCVINGAFEWVFYKKLNLMSELSWQTQGDRKLDGNWTADTGKSTLVWSIGIGYSEKYWQALFGYQRTLIGENADANDTIAGTVIVTF